MPPLMAKTGKNSGLADEAAWEENKGMEEAAATLCTGCQRLQAQLEVQRLQIEALQATVAQLAGVLLWTSSFQKTAEAAAYISAEVRPTISVAALLELARWCRQRNCSQPTGSVAEGQARLLYLATEAFAGLARACERNANG